MSTIQVLTLKSVIANSCPFCLQDQASIAGGSGSDYFVKCTNCFAKGPSDASADIAVDLWNAALHSMQREVTELKAQVDTLMLNLATATSLAAETGTIKPV